jgi:hypothetical protein
MDQHISRCLELLELLWKLAKEHRNESIVVGRTGKDCRCSSFFLSCSIFIRLCRLHRILEQFDAAVAGISILSATILQ